LELNKKYWDLLNNLEIISIVAIAPRPGTDFLHSLFDMHPQVLTFDGWLMFHSFYENSVTMYGTNKFIVGNAGAVSTVKIEEVNPKDFFYEFAWNHIHKFDSRYDTLEKKDKLGVCKNEFNTVSIDTFVNNAVGLLGDEELTSKNALLATYGSFGLSRKEELNQKKVLLHHVHLPSYVSSLSNDFSNIKIIACMRDPRVYGTKINTYLNKLHLSSICIGSTNAIFNSTIEGATKFKDNPNVDVRINVLEKLHNQPELTLRSICKWIGVDYHANLLQSTWGGKQWYGDSISTNEIISIFNKNRYKFSQKEWVVDLSIIDRIIIENLMSYEMKNCDYEKETNYYLWFIFVPLFILLPTKYEMKIFWSIIKGKQNDLFMKLIIIILLRYNCSYKKYFKNIFHDSHQSKPF
jgi:hypothetical protein